MALQAAHLAEESSVRCIVLDKVASDGNRVSRDDAALLLLPRNPKQDLKRTLERQDLLHFGVPASESNHQQKHLIPDDLARVGQDVHELGQPLRARQHRTL